MNTRITTVSELKNIMLEILFSKTNKISKTSNTGVANSIAYANAKIAQKCLKDIAVLESQLLPEFSSGEYLDEIAKRYGIFERLSQLGSSAYIYIYGEEGTVYTKGTNNFISNDGITFELEEETVTIPDYKYVYAKVASVEVGAKTNVEPLSILTCTNPPSGHRFCINEFAAVGGRNEEDDEMLLFRIQNIHNVLATKTLDYLVQIALRKNQNILRFVHLGTKQGKIRLGVVTQNGAYLSDEEINELIIYLQDYFSVADIADPVNTRVVIENVAYTPIDLSFKLDYLRNYTVDEIYSLIQKKLVSYLDFRFWDLSKKVQWGELFNIVKNTEGVVSVPYADFKVNGGQNDITVKRNVLPRFRSFLLYDLMGNTLLNVGSDAMAPIIYPTYADSNFDVYGPVVYQ